jgi:hypothetical protein
MAGHSRYVRVPQHPLGGESRSEGRSRSDISVPPQWRAGRSFLSFALALYTCPNFTPKKGCLGYRWLLLVTFTYRLNFGRRAFGSAFPRGASREHDVLSRACEAPLGFKWPRPQRACTSLLGSISINKTTDSLFHASTLAWGVWTSAVQPHPYRKLSSIAHQRLATVLTNKEKKTVFPVL